MLSNSFHHFPVAFFPCECTSNEHVISMMFSNSELENPAEHCIYISAPLNTYSFSWHDFFVRVKNAYKYLLKKEREYGDFDCTIFREDDYDRLIEFLSKIKNVSGVDFYNLEKKNFIDIEDGCEQNILRIVADKEEKDIPKELIAFVFLKDEKSILRRIFIGLRYILGHRCAYGMFDCFEVKYSQVQRIIRLIQECQESCKKFDSKTS